MYCMYIWALYIKRVRINFLPHWERMQQVKYPAATLAQSRHCAAGPMPSNQLKDIIPTVIHSLLLSCVIISLDHSF